MKYLRESYYYHIECSVTNSLTALIWKWYLNSNLHPYSYSQKFQKGVDGIGINIRNLVYTWRVEMTEGRQYKRERIPWGDEIREWREKYYRNKSWTCNQIQKRYIQELISSNCAENVFLKIKLVYFCFLVIWANYNCCLTY